MRELAFGIHDCSAPLPAIRRYGAVGTTFAQLLTHHFPAQIERLAPVCARQLLGAVAVACFDRPQQAAMFLERFSRSALAVERAGSDLPHVIEKRLQELEQAVVMRGATHQLDIRTARISNSNSTIRICIVAYPI